MFSFTTKIKKRVWIWYCTIEIRSPFSSQPLEEIKKKFEGKLKSDFYKLYFETIYKTASNKIKLTLSNKLLFLK